MSYHNNNNDGLPFMCIIPALILMGVCWPLAIVWFVGYAFIADNINIPYESKMDNQNFNSLDSFDNDTDIQYLNNIIKEYDIPENHQYVVLLSVNNYEPNICPCIAWMKDYNSINFLLLKPNPEIISKQVTSDKIYINTAGLLNEYTSFIENSDWNKATPEIKRIFLNYIDFPNSKYVSEWVCRVNDIKVSKSSVRSLIKVLGYPEKPLYIEKKFESYFPDLYSNSMR